MSQADDFAAAIDAALKEVSMKHARPELNAMLGALAGRLGGGLALVNDESIREKVYDKVCQEIRRTMSIPTKNKAVLVPVERQ